jgi:hypothetical protein
MATFSEPTDDDDIETFLAEIETGIGHINPVITIDLNHKTVHCYLCKETVEVERTYRLDETCPDCFSKLRDRYLRIHS